MKISDYDNANIVYWHLRKSGKTNNRVESACKRIWLAINLWKECLLKDSDLEIITSYAKRHNIQLTK